VIFFTLALIKSFQLEAVFKKRKVQRPIKAIPHSKKFISIKLHLLIGLPSFDRMNSVISQSKAAHSKI
jgi:hypothetical protein